MSVMQFKEVALIGTDGNYLKFSPFVEGVEGASRTILVTENNEEVKIEDDQTVFTSVKNTITIVAPVLDSQIATLNTWKSNDAYVGFAGYTIGGVVYAPAMNSEDNAFENYVVSAVTQSVGSRGDIFQISEVQQVDSIKHTFRIVLTQTCLQGRSALGTLYGIQPNVNLLNTGTVSKARTASGVAPAPWMSWANGPVAFQQGLNITPTGNAFNMVCNDNASGNLVGTFFFPFGRTINVVATGLGTNGTQTVFARTLDSTFGEIQSDAQTLSTGLGSIEFSLDGEPQNSFVRIELQKTSTGATGTMRLDDISIRIV